MYLYIYIYLNTFTLKVFAFESFKVICICIYNIHFYVLDPMSGVTPHLTLVAVRRPLLSRILAPTSE